MTRAILLLFFCLCCCASCALTSKSDALVPRYYTPEPFAQTQPAKAQGELRLGRVSSSAHLRESIVYRDSPLEVGFYDENRWTERPDAYLRRALARALFEQRGYRRVLTGQAPTLDVELVAFEEIRKPKRAARIVLTFALHDEHVTKAEETITIERPVAPGGGMDVFVKAAGEALAAAVDQVSARVAEAAGP
jgi:cholesterol transport system auxiliary component